MTKSGNDLWVISSARIIGVPKMRRHNRERVVSADDFPAFRKRHLLQQDEVMIQGLVSEMTQLAAIASLHEDEDWASDADECFEQNLSIAVSVAKSEKELLPELYCPEIELSIQIVDDGSLGWGDLAMDDYQDEEDLIAELNAREDKGWE